MKSTGVAVLFLAMAELCAGTAWADRGGPPHSGWQGSGFQHGWQRNGFGREHHRHPHGGVIFLGPALLWPGYRQPFDDPFYPYPPAPVIVQPPPVYIERGGNPPGNFWYYCQAAGAYYPNVTQCPGGWTPVAPQPEQP